MDCFIIVLWDTPLVCWIPKLWRVLRLLALRQMRRTVWITVGYRVSWLTDWDLCGFQLPMVWAVITQLKNHFCNMAGPICLLTSWYMVAVRTDGETSSSELTMVYSTLTARLIRWNAWRGLMPCVTCRYIVLSLTERGMYGWAPRKVSGIIIARLVCLQVTCRGMDSKQNNMCRMQLSCCLMDD